jgi:hypothetical protein
MVLIAKFPGPFFRSNHPRLLWILGYMPMVNMVTRRKEPIEELFSSEDVSYVK